MAQIEESGSGDRDVNVEVNLVPFIDLMSVCIIFLLVTAVWTQVSMIQIGSSIYAKRQDAVEAVPPPKQTVSFKLTIRNSGYIVSLNTNSVQIPKQNDDYDDQRLLTYLKTVKEKYPDKDDVTITMDDNLTYDNLIRGMDVLMLSGFTEIGIAAASGG